MFKKLRFQMIDNRSRSWLVSMPGLSPVRETRKLTLPSGDLDVRNDDESRVGSAVLVHSRHWAPRERLDAYPFRVKRAAISMV